MDSSVIQEIANQLGIAADKVWEFAPEYGAMMADRAYQNTIIAGIVFAVFVALAIVLGVKACSYEDEVPDAVMYAFATIFVCALLSGLVLFIVCAVNLPDAWAWSHHPQAMLDHTLASKIG